MSSYHSKLQLMMSQASVMFHVSLHAVNNTDHGGKHRAVDSETDDEDEVWEPSGNDEPDHDHNREGETVLWLQSFVLYNNNTPA